MSLFVSQLSFYTIKWTDLYDDFTVAEMFAIGCCQLYRRPCFIGLFKILFRPSDFIRLV